MRPLGGAARFLVGHEHLIDGDDGVAFVFLTIAVNVDKIFHVIRMGRVNSPGHFDFIRFPPRQRDRPK